MYERLDQEGPRSRSLPYPLYELPLDGQPIDPLLVGTILRTLLEQSAGLAGTIYSATLYEDTAYQDVQQACHVLSEWLNTTLAVWRRWEEQQEAGR